MLATLTSVLLLGGFGLASTADIGVEGKDWHWARHGDLPEHELVKRGTWNTSTALVYEGFGMALTRLSEPLEPDLNANILPFSRLLGSLQARQGFVCDNPEWGKCPQRDTCAPLDAQCCGTGEYHCRKGTYCMRVHGCCPDGKRCREVGESECRDPSYTPCQNRDDMCVSPGSDCCTDSWRSCPPGQQCYNSWCCPSGQAPCHKCETRNRDECGDYCMPRGAVCCGQGYYCDAGETCIGISRCRGGRRGGGGGGGGGGDEPAPSVVGEETTSTSEWKEEATSTSEWKEEATSTSEWKEESTSEAQSATPWVAGGATGGGGSPTTTSYSYGPEVTAKTVSSGGLSITSVNPDDIAWQGEWRSTSSCSGNARVTESEAAATIKLDGDVQGYSMSWDLDTYTEIEIDNDGRKSTIRGDGSGDEYGTTKSGCRVNYVWTFDSPGIHQVFFRTVYYGEKRQSQIRATLNEINIYKEKADVPGSSNSNSAPGSPTPTSRTSISITPSGNGALPSAATSPLGVGRSGEEIVAQAGAGRPHGSAVLTAALVLLVGCMV